MTKPLATALSLLVAGAALAEPNPTRESSRPTPVEQADRQFLAAEASKPITAPAAIPAPAPTTSVVPVATGPAPVAIISSAPASGEMTKTRTQPKAALPADRVERDQPPKVGSKATAKVKPAKTRVAAQKPAAVRRAMPAVLPPSYTTRTESRDRVVLKHYEFPSAGRVRITTTVTRYDDDDDDSDRDEAEDDD